MTPDECNDAVRDHSMVVFKTADGREHARGRVFAYSIVPVLHIETEHGDRMTWRHDMAELLPVDPCVGKRVRVVVEGEITEHDADEGRYVVLGHAATKSGGHVPWEYELHWSTDFEFVDEVTPLT